MLAVSELVLLRLELVDADGGVVVDFFLLFLAVSVTKGALASLSSTGTEGKGTIPMACSMSRTSNRYVFDRREVYPYL